MNGSTLLADWRKRRGHTQATAAKLIGVSQTSLSDYERDRKKPGVEIAIAIAHVTDGDVPVAAWGETRSEAHQRMARVHEEIAAKSAPVDDDAPPESHDSTPERDRASGE